MSVTESHHSDILSLFKSENYELLEKIGEGGFGQVYKAKQKSTDQFVAIKILTLNPSFDAEKRKRYIERFERETVLCSRLNHPNIVRLLDKGQSGEEFIFAVFEFVDGQSLKEKLIESGPMKAVDAAEVMTQVLDGLAHAHAQGVIHRDIKPANIMLMKVGAKMHAKILDFGIGTLAYEARHLDYKTITLTQETLGTPSYCAPEQLRGEPPTNKSDIYVWGLVFIECLTGRPAVSGSNLASIFHKQLSPNNIPLPPAIAGHPVASLLRRVLNKKASERSQSAESVYDEFTKINFSSIVGDTGEIPLPLSDSSTTEVMDCFETTVISDDKAYYTGLTERKQINVLCLTLAVKKVVSERLDHEVIDTLYRDQKAECVDIAVRYSAFHVGGLGDTVLFYFGYPAVSDNDSRLCARTALDILSTINKRNTLLKSSQGIEFDARIGIHSGLVTAHSDMVPEGDTPNTAMALARQAKVNQIVCSDVSRKILDSYLEFNYLEVKALGVDDNEVAIHELKGERLVEAFGFLRANRKHKSFIGRDRELGFLQELTESSSPETRAMSGHVHGEAGIGKSRLLLELRERSQQFKHYVFQCLPEHKFSALYPILNAVKHDFSLSSMTTDEAVKQVVSFVDNLNKTEKSTVLSLLCSWLDLPLPEDSDPVTLSPDEQKNVLFDVLSHMLCFHRDNESSLPHLFIFEDMHWADPTSIEFIQFFLASSSYKENDHVFISTSRQALPEALVNSDYRSIEVEKLTEDKTGEFIVKLFDDDVVSDNVIKLVIERTDGIPLFIEELVNMLIQREFVQRINAVIDFAHPDKLNEIPGSLRESLQQKLDSLVNAKETAQVASVIGREFEIDLLVAASNRTCEQVQSDLDELIELELVYKQRRVNADSYIFKHALVRDAAYESNTSSVRARWHESVARAMQNNDAYSDSANLVTISSHFESAGLLLDASQAILPAIKHAANIANHMQAIQLFERFDTWSETLPDNKDVNHLEFDINSAIAPVLLAQEGMGSMKVVEVSERLELLSEKLGLDESDWHESIFMRKWIYFQDLHYRCSETRKAIEVGRSLLSYAESNQYRQGVMLVRALLVQVYTCAGELDNAIEVGASVPGMFDESEDSLLYQKFGWDPKSVSYSHMAHAYILQGEVETAFDFIRRAEAHAKFIESEIDVDVVDLFKYLLVYCIEDKQFIFDEISPLESSAFSNERNYMEDNWYKLFSQLAIDWAYSNTKISNWFCQQMLGVGRGGPFFFWITMWLDVEIQKQCEASVVTDIEKLILNYQGQGLDGPVPTLFRTFANYYSSVGNVEKAKHYLISGFEQARKSSMLLPSIQLAVDYGKLINEEGAKDKSLEMLNSIQDDNCKTLLEKLGSTVGLPDYVKQGNCHLDAVG